MANVCTYRVACIKKNVPFEVCLDEYASIEVSKWVGWWKWFRLVSTFQVYGQKKCMIEFGV